MVLLFTGNWAWAIGVFVTRNIIFGIGKASVGTKVTQPIRSDVEAIGYNDDSPAQVEKAKRAFQLLAKQSSVNPRFHMFPAELDEAVEDWGSQSRSSETPIIHLTAWSIASKQLEASAMIWGSEALEAETGSIKVADMDNELRKAFPDWYTQSNVDALPAAVAQRLHAYIFMLMVFAISNKHEIVG